MVYLSLILVIIFFILSIIHFNWVRGGTWGFDNALPTNENGERILNPRKIDSLIVNLKNTGTQRALAKVVFFPIMMLICYLILIFYFKSKGGYKPVALN